MSRSKITPETFEALQQMGADKAQFEQSTPITTGNLAQELRDLARQIERDTLSAPCLSVAWSIVQQCCDHLTLLAGWHEAQARVESKRAFIQETMQLECMPSTWMDAAKHHTEGK